MKTYRAVMCAAAGVAFACRSSGSPSAPPPAAATPSAASAPMVREGVRVGDTFVPKRGDDAIRAFVADVPAEETGGECSVVRTGGSGATIVTAYYPARATPRLQVTVWFDSAGRLARYSERRGIPRIRTTPNMTAAQIDSVIRAEEAKIRSTSISLDYAIDQAVASNRGGGRPTDAVLGTVRAVENLDSLGPPVARLERMRKLCGV